MVDLDYSTVISLYITAVFAGSLSFLHLFLRSHDRNGTLLLTLSYIEIGLASIFASLGEYNILTMPISSCISLLLGVSGYATFFIGIRALDYSRTKKAYYFYILIVLIILFLTVFSDIWENDEIRASVFHISAAVFLFLASNEVYKKKKSEPLVSRNWLSHSLLGSSLGFFIVAFCILSMSNYLSIIAMGFSFQIMTSFLTSIFIYSLVKERVEKKLQIASEIDSLTGIGNRRWFYSSIPNTIRNSDSILMIDLDFFKNVNDTYGHQAGDEVLIASSENIKNNIRTNDLFSRFGGEEFIIFMPNTKLPDVLTVSERIRKSIENQTISFSGKQIKITISIGIAWNNNEIRTISEMIGIADQALYKAKNNGRNRVEIELNGIA